MRILGPTLCLLAGTATAEIRNVFLEDGQGKRIEIASVQIDGERRYDIMLNQDVFTDHFLSMRPFKCVEGPEKHWCHVPYPYEIKRDISKDLTDLEYDFLFLWKSSTDYGIDTWNGVYYQLEAQEAAWVGTLHEIDLGELGIPPEDGDLRPIQAKDLHETEGDSHWLPRLIIE